MFSTIFWKFRLFARRLWVRSVLMSGVAILVAALSPLSHLLPFSWSYEIDEQALSDLLSILTNSMLTVTTFSLSIMVSAHLAADGNATPRAHRLLQEDGRTQTVIATFIGAFIYALTLTVMMNMGVFEQEDYALVYAATVAVMVGLVIAILRWVAHLSGLGSVEATIRRVEERARACLSDRMKLHFMGARDIRGTQVPTQAPAFHAPSFGYIQNIDVKTLSTNAGGMGATVYLMVSPGDWVHEGQVLGVVNLPELDQSQEDLLRAPFSIGDRREYDQDATFSLVVLAEIAERALSPGINDPRTGIDVIGRLTRMIVDIPVEEEMDDPPYPNVFAHALDVKDLMLATLDPIARDGRTFVEVQLTIQRAYRTLSTNRDPIRVDAAMALSARGLSYARDGIMMVEDLQRIARFAPADHMAATSTTDPHESVVEALGEERNSSYFREV